MPSTASTKFNMILGRYGTGCSIPGVIPGITLYMPIRQPKMRTAAKIGNGQFPSVEAIPILSFSPRHALLPFLIILLLVPQRCTGRESSNRHLFFCGFVFFVSFVLLCFSCLHITNNGCFRLFPLNPKMTFCFLGHTRIKYAKHTNLLFTAIRASSTKYGSSKK